MNLPLWKKRLRGHPRSAEGGRGAEDFLDPSGQMLPNSYWYRALSGSVPGDGRGEGARDVVGGRGQGRAGRWRDRRRQYDTAVSGELAALQCLGHWVAVCRAPVRHHWVVVRGRQNGNDFGQWRRVGRVSHGRLDHLLVRGSVQDGFESRLALCGERVEALFIEI